MNECVNHSWKYSQRVSTASGSDRIIETTWKAPRNIVSALIGRGRSPSLPLGVLKRQTQFESRAAAILQGRELGRAACFFHSLPHTRSPKARSTLSSGSELFPIVCPHRRRNAWSAAVGA